MTPRYKTMPVVIAGVLTLTMLWLGAGIAASQEKGTGLVDPTRIPPPAAPSAGEAAPAGLAATGAPASAIAASASPTTAPAAVPEPEEPAVPGKPLKIVAAGGVIAQFPMENAPIRQVLRLLARESGKNIVPGKGVTGTITAELSNVTWREALDAVVRVSELGCLEEGNFIYVYTQKELDAIRKAQRKMGSKVFALHYAKPDDVKAMIVPCLSGDGKITASPMPLAGVGPSETTSGGMDYAVNDMLVVADYEENLKRVEEVIKEVDKRPQQVLIEATILSVKLKEDNSLGIDFSSLAGVNLKEVGFNTDFTSTGALSNATGGLSVRWLGSDMSVFLEAMETVSDTNVLANPKLLVVNRQRGEILVGDRQGYFDLTNTTQTGGTTASVSFLNTGTNLIIRPFIGDNGYVRLEVFPKSSTGTVNSTTHLPSESTTQCTSNVLVKDGHTIVISGLFRNLITNSRSQIPVLGNVPGAGVLFRSTGDNVTREEVVILITPRIVKETPDMVVGQELLDDVERITMGMRHNLNWFGRNRLAACHLNWAKEHMANGRTDKALWDLDLALNMCPGMREAQDLKEYLTGQAIWANEPRVSSARYIVQRMVMNDLGLNVNLITYPGKPLDANQVPQKAREAMGIENTPQAPLLPKVAPNSQPAQVKPVSQATDVIPDTVVSIVDEPVETPNSVAPAAVDSTEATQAESNEDAGLPGGTVKAVAADIVTDTPGQE